MKKKKILLGLTLALAASMVFTSCDRKSKKKKESVQSSEISKESSSLESFESSTNDASVNESNTNTKEVESSDVYIPTNIISSFESLSGTTIESSESSIESESSSETIDEDLDFGQYIKSLESTNHLYDKVTVREEIFDGEKTEDCSYVLYRNGKWESKRKLISEEYYFILFNDIYKKVDKSNVQYDKDNKVFILTVNDGLTVYKYGLDGYLTEAYFEGKKGYTKFEFSFREDNDDFEEITLKELYKDIENSNYYMYDSAFVTFNANGQMYQESAQLIHDKDKNIWDNIDSNYKNLPYELFLPYMQIDSAVKVLESPNINLTVYKNDYDEYKLLIEVFQDDIYIHAEYYYNSDFALYNLNYSRSDLPGTEYTDYFVFNFEFVSKKCAIIDSNAFMKFKDNIKYNTYDYVDILEYNNGKMNTYKSEKDYIWNKVGKVDPNYYFLTTAFSDEEIIKNDNAYFFSYEDAMKVVFIYRDTTNKIVENIEYTYNLDGSLKSYVIKEDGYVTYSALFSFGNNEVNFDIKEINYYIENADKIRGKNTFSICKCYNYEIEPNQEYHFDTNGWYDGNDKATSDIRMEDYLQYLIKNGKEFEFIKNDDNTFTIIVYNKGLKEKRTYNEYLYLTELNGMIVDEYNLDYIEHVMYNYHYDKYFTREFALEEFEKIVDNTEHIYYNCIEVNEVLHPQAYVEEPLPEGVIINLDNAWTSILDYNFYLSNQLENIKYSMAKYKLYETEDSYLVNLYGYQLLYYSKETLYLTKLIYLDTSYSHLIANAIYEFNYSNVKYIELPKQSAIEASLNAKFKDGTMLDLYISHFNYFKEQSNGNYLFYEYNTQTNTFDSKSNQLDADTLVYKYTDDAIYYQTNNEIIKEVISFEDKMIYVDIYTYDKSTGYIKTHIIQIYEGKTLIEKITYEYDFITERESASVEILPA